MIKKYLCMAVSTVTAILMILLVSPLVAFSQSMESASIEWEDDNPHRVEPEGDGTVYEVCFLWQNRILYDSMAVLEGQGIGPKQWLEEWHRTNYIFMGWYNNPNGAGERYSMYTPIYEDTSLYPLWKYAGPGGPWPRTNPRGITGVTANENFQPGVEVSITVAGHNTHLVNPPSERFRWIPISWRIDSLIQGEFTDTIPYSFTRVLSASGSYHLYITYIEEVFEGISWQETGREHEVAELPFSVGFEYAIKNTPQANSTSQEPECFTESMAEQDNITPELPEKPTDQFTAADLEDAKSHKSSGWGITTVFAIFIIIISGAVAVCVWKQLRRRVNNAHKG